MTAALGLLEGIEARRLANEELAAATTDVLSRAVFANRAEAYQTALRLVARALPAIVAEAQADGTPPNRGMAETDSATWAPGELVEVWGK